jgi:vacuolar-type H+-ATPase subunit I/STV1
MTTLHNLKRLQQLIWVFIYGGLLTLVLGLSVERNDEALGFSMALGGGGLALLGAVLIYVRSRLKAD